MKTAPRKWKHTTIDNGETTVAKKKKKKQQAAAGKENNTAETEMTGKDKRKGIGRGKSRLSCEVITDQQEQEAEQPLSNNTCWKCDAG